MWPKTEGCRAVEKLILHNFQLASIDRQNFVVVLGDIVGF
jgi:hypothetical protein